MFWENEHVELKSTQRLEKYLNRRMVGDQKGLCIKVGKLVLNHNDIAPRNIIWMPDGSICLIDWAHAGYYPQVVEIVVLGFNTQAGKDLKFTTKLRDKLGPLTAQEEEEVNMLEVAWFNGHRYRM
jgi:Ser/Thr protein kinase RdoA (MazF antagonist)